jgi:hypothetical protein
MPAPSAVRLTADSSKTGNQPAKSVYGSPTASKSELIFDTCHGFNQSGVFKDGYQEESGKEEGRE